MDNGSGKINYWPGFVDAFSNLVLALVFVIVILAMSLGMFSGLMAKMAIQRALVEQRLKESQAISASSASAGTGSAPAAVTPPGAAVAPDDEAASWPAGAEPAGAQEAGPPPQPGADGVSMPPPAAADRHDTAAAPAPDAAVQAALRRENDALRQELAALRRKQATPSQAPRPAASGATAAAPDAPRSQDPFGPMMPGGDPNLQRRIDADLRRVLKEFSAQRDSAAVIQVVIHVPNYALTENKRTALFYLISIKDYLMKKNVSPERIRMHMAPAPAGQKDMTVSMSVER